MFLNHCSSRLILNMNRCTLSLEDENAQRQQLNAELRLLSERQRRMYLNETITAIIRLSKKKIVYRDDEMS